ncbi:hypothetical protein [Halobacillus trueperi]|uniref:hypothetical protein n=1 Tax=Halobacillus trueperi TaxID=156205 RepID=UPI003736C737
MILKKGILAIPVMLLLLLVVWIAVGKSEAYEEPKEALRATEKGLTLIPVERMNGKALLIFRKDDLHLHIGAANVEKDKHTDNQMKLLHKTMEKSWIR